MRSAARKRSARSPTARTHLARVDKIVGPGNVWVTEAKRQVFGTCGIDGLAGPSEVLVVADASSKPEFVAGEMIAQAEHDPLARVAAVSEDRALLERVAALLDGPFAKECGRGAIVERVLASAPISFTLAIGRRARGDRSLRPRAPFAADRRPVDARAARLRAPAPSSSAIRRPWRRATTSPAAITSCRPRARRASRPVCAPPIFYRTMSLIENSQTRMRADAEQLAALADFEGLPAHARSARMRAQEP
jgi:hypothetical protein